MKVNCTTLGRSGCRSIHLMLGHRGSDNGDDRSMERAVVPPTPHPPPCKPGFQEEGCFVNLSLATVSVTVGKKTDHTLQPNVHGHYCCLESISLILRYLCAIQGKISPLHPGL